MREVTEDGVPQEMHLKAFPRKNSEGTLLRKLVSLLYVSSHLVSKTILVAPLILVLSASAQVRYSPMSALDEFRQQWYSDQLKALEEPSLFELSKDKTMESYRFVWLRSFHHPIAIRLEVRQDGTGVLSTKIASGAGGYKPGHLIENVSRPVFRWQIGAVKGRLTAMRFWSVPEPDSRSGEDGAQWIVEGIRDGRYQILDRWSPERGPVRDFGLTLLGMAELKIPSKELY